MIEEDCENSEWNVMSEFCHVHRNTLSPPMNEG